MRVYQLRLSKKVFIIINLLLFIIAFIINIMKPSAISNFT